MKKIITTLIFISTIGYMTAQPNRCFTYDAAGNRTQRILCGNSGLATEDNDGIKQKETIEKEAIAENRETDKKLEVLLFPNPTEGHFSIQMSEVTETTTLLIYDFQGKLVMNQRYGNGEFDISHFASGTYYLVLRDRDVIWSGKVVRR